VPRTVHAALRDPAWFAAMQDKYHVLKENDTWELVPRPRGAHVITGKWIFKNKFHADSMLECRKARWVVRGFSQRPSLDFDQMFSPVAKPVTLRTICISRLKVIGCS